MNDLAEVKQVSKANLHSFLQEDHTSFSVLSVSAKHIKSTQRLTVTLTKNSAKSFYVRQSHPSQKKYCYCLTSGQIKLTANGTYSFCSPSCSIKTWLSPVDNCLTDAQNCAFFNLFNSKEKKLYTKFLDKVEANFEGLEANTPLLFLTLTFNTSDQDYYAFTTNWDQNDPCWDKVSQKKPWYPKWARSFDPQAELLKVHISPVELEVSQVDIANALLTKFLKSIRRLWKPQQWKWVVVRELQKNGNWHFHLLSTPIVPYSHKCTLSKSFKSCANCRAYISKLWPYGQVESRSPGNKSISQYLAKYLSKSFHLRKLYQEHGLTDYSRTYSFFKNLYSYEQLEALLANSSKIDAITYQYLPKNQKVFRHYDTMPQLKPPTSTAPMKP